MKNLKRRLCAKQASDMLEDLNAEVDRREGRASKKKQGSSKAAPAASLGLSHSGSTGTFEGFFRPLMELEPLVSFNIRL